MAISAVNLSYVGLGPSAGQQIIADQTSGPKSKSLVGFGTAILDGTATTFTANYIDGVQTMGRTVILPLQSVLASVPTPGTGALTLTAVAASSGGTAVYTGTITGGAANAFVGVTFTIAGFLSPQDNGIFVATASTATTLTLTNPNAIAATHAATATSGFAVYNSTGGDLQIKAGDSVVIAGFSNSVNNGTFTVISSNSTSVTVNNGSAVAETNPAATMLDVQNAIPVVVVVGRDGNALDTAAVSTTVQVSAVTSTGFTVTISAAGTALQSLSFAAQIFFGS